MTKVLACEVVISDEVRATAGLAEDALPAQEVVIRGRNEPMIVRTATDARMLPALVNGEQSVAA
jgi:adenylate cyclase